MCPSLCLLLTQASGELRLTNRRTIWIAALEVFVKKRFALEAKPALTDHNLSNQFLCSEMLVSEDHTGLFVT